MESLELPSNNLAMQKEHEFVGADLKVGKNEEEALKAVGAKMERHNECKKQ